VGIGVTSLLDVQAAAREFVIHGRGAQHLSDGSAAAPEWVLDVEEVARAKVRAGVQRAASQGGAGGGRSVDQVTHKRHTHTCTHTLTHASHTHNTRTLQVLSGGLAERVAPEGAMLQYAVDAHLDEALRVLWLQVRHAGVLPSFKLWLQVRHTGVLPSLKLWLQVQRAHTQMRRCACCGCR